MIVHITVKSMDETKRLVNVAAIEQIIDEGDFCILVMPKENIDTQLTLKELSNVIDMAVARERFHEQHFQSQHY